MSDFLEGIEALIFQGRFLEALAALDRGGARRDSRNESEALRVEVLERTGRYGHSRAIADRLLRTSGLGPKPRSICELALGNIELDDGNVQPALARFQRALSCSEAAGDLRRVAWCQLRMIPLIAEIAGQQAVASLLARARGSTTRLGDPVFSAALHLTMSELEAKRGLLQGATRHLRIGSSLLSRGQNIWLEAVAENVRTALAIMSSDYEEALRCGQRALALSDESGAAAMKRATLSNVGSIFYRMGKFGEAVDYFQRALSCLPTNGERTNGVRESLARVCLVQQDLEQAGLQLLAIEDSIKTAADWALYANRHSRITQAELFIRRGQKEQASMACEQATELASRTGDAILEVAALLLKVEILVTTSGSNQATSLLARVADLVGQLPHEVFAHYERALACGLASVRHPTAGVHLERSKRISIGLHSVPAQLELDRLAETLATSSQCDPPAQSACSVYKMSPP